MRPQRLYRRYGVQSNLVGFFYLLYVVIGRTFYRLQLLQLQCFATMGVSFLFKELDGLWQLTLFLLGLGYTTRILLIYDRKFSSRIIKSLKNRHYTASVTVSDTVMD